MGKWEKTLPWVVFKYRVGIENKDLPEGAHEEMLSFLAQVGRKMDYYERNYAEKRKGPPEQEA